MSIWRSKVGDAPLWRRVSSDVVSRKVSAVMSVCPTSAVGERAPSLRAVLFDLDGVLVDSAQSVDRHWSNWASRHGLRPQDVLAVAHGHRTVETMRQFLFTCDEDAAARFEEEQANDCIDVTEIPGAKAFLDDLRLPWAVVTSGSRRLATARMIKTGLPLVTTLVAGDEVTRGKPDPEGYRLAADLLGVSAEQCLVIEDAPSGIAAGLAAGAVVAAVETTWPRSALAAATWCVDSHRALWSLCRKLVRSGIQEDRV
jgi:sugar-phosphatase